MSAVRSKYYVGDIHGRADLLETLLSGIEAHASACSSTPEIVFLGDLTDRGPDSVGVLNLVHAALQKWEGSKLILGNHDEWFLETAKNVEYEYAESWLMNGGIQTIMSYCDGDVPADAMIQIREKYPNHIRMLQDASRYDTNGLFIGVHAGVHPLRQLSEQREFDLNWIREPFLSFAEPQMPPVIHGHTILGRRPEVTENRISIDTGAFASDLLTTCYVDAENKTIRFFQAGPEGFDEVAPSLVDRGYGTVYDRLDELFEA